MQRATKVEYNKNMQIIRAFKLWGWILYLTRKGFVCSKLGITPRNELKINDGDKVMLEELNEVIDNEIGTVRAQAFIVQTH